MLTDRSQKIDLLLRSGVRTFIDLTESGELSPYQPHLAAHVSRLGIDEEHEPVEYYPFPIPDRRLPRSVTYVRQILHVLKDTELLAASPPYTAAVVLTARASSSAAGSSSRAWWRTAQRRSISLPRNGKR